MPIVKPNSPLHPGEIVLDYLDHYGWSQQDLARRSGITPKTISEICNGKAPITSTTGLAFEKVFQRPAHFWLNLQRDFDEALSRQKQLVSLASWNEWAQHFPLREMKQLGYELPKGSSDADVILNYFGVSSPGGWNSVWKASSVAYRQTRRFQTKEESIAAWVRRVELLSMEFDLAEFSDERLRSSLEALRLLTKEPYEKIFDPVQDICAAAGVAVVWVPELKNTGISGCARWLTDKKAVIGLTFRYKKDDQLWFTFFHELGHLLLHKNKRSFVIDNAAEDLSDQVIDPDMLQYEVEANRFAADVLIPPDDLRDFISQSEFTTESILEFAEAIGVGPGIVVGQLQHLKILRPSQGNSLKQTIKLQLKEGDSK